MENPYDVLGIARSSGEEEIRSAFKRRAMELHPDRGGRTDQFQLIVWARDLLLDSQRRATYDETGTDPQRSNRIASIREDLAKLFRHVIEQASDVKKTDILLVAKRILEQSRNQLQVERKKVQKYIERSEEALQRTTIKNEDFESQFVLEMMKIETKKDRAKLDEIDVKIATHDTIEKMLENFEYAVDEGASAPQFVTFFSTG
jgi:curved DNA-binding protein CbpA